MTTATISNQTLTFPQIRAFCSTPSLNEIALVLNDALGEQFQTASVEVVDCPDLTRSPFNLASPGLCGQYSYVADVGGPPYLVPMVDRTKIYSFENILSNLNAPNEHLSTALVVGASAGPFHDVGTNCELVPNASFKRSLEKGSKEYSLVKNNTHFAQIVPGHGIGHRLSKSPSTEFCLLGNLFISEGKPGKVLQVRCSVRKGEENFISAIRKILHQHFSDKDARPISAGGVFVIQTGKAKLHIMPDFSLRPLNTDQDVNDWLKFFEMDSPLTCLTAFHSCDPGLDLRVEHTHCFSEHDQGGHYHYDTTPEDVSYLAYLNIANEIVRIDPPPESHQIGRD